MGRVKEAVLASLARPIVSSRQCAMVSLAHPIVSSVSAGHPWCTPLSVPSVRYGLRHRLLSSYIDHKIRQNIYTGINIPE